MPVKEAICNRYIRPLAPIPTGVAPDLSKMRSFSAMIFDVYGTLLISGAGDIGLAQKPPVGAGDLRSLVRRFASHLSPERLAERLNLAIQRFHAAAHERGIDCPEVDIVQVWRQVLDVDDLSSAHDFALEYELIVNPVYPMPGAKELLSACTAHHLPMGIISNAQDYTVVLLQHFFGAALERAGFDHRLLFFSWREGHAKPSTFMFDRAKSTLLDMGIPTASALYVGNDMLNDILPAKSAGFTTALFAGDRQSLRQRESDGRCRGISPDLIVTDLRQLIKGTGHL
jgi:putative hydrolase of the HAD superfamily